jgi:hypothetical protein
LIGRIVVKSYLQNHDESVDRKGVDATRRAIVEPYHRASVFAANR